MADAEHIILYETPVYGRPEVNKHLWHSSDFVANNPQPGNPHYIGPFRATQYGQPLLSQAEDIPPVPVVDVPTYFIAAFKFTRFANDRALYEQPPKDFSSALQFETNTHYLAPFKPTTYFRDSFPQPIDQPTVFVADVPVYFIATYKAAKFFNDKGLYQQPAQDTSSALKFETNTHFIATFTPTKYKIDLTSGKFASIDGLPPLPPTSNPVYARYGASHGIGALTAIPGEIPS